MQKLCFVCRVPRDVNDNGFCADCAENVDYTRFVKAMLNYELNYDKHKQVHSASRAYERHRRYWRHHFVNGVRPLKSERQQ